jgi:hypothetical protein
MRPASTSNCPSRICYPHLVELVREKVFSKSQPDAPEALVFYYKYVVEPGEFEIMVGKSSRDADLEKVILRVT